METAYVLQHTRADDEYGDDAKMIGVYRSEANAKAAIARLRDQPGFIDHPDGWHISAYAIDKDHWEEGFITIDGAL